MFLNKMITLVNRNGRSVSFVALCMLLSGAAYAGYKKWESNWYRSLIIAEVEVGDTRLISHRSGFRGGCGVAIFELTPRMLERLSIHGLAAFDGLVSQHAEALGMPSLRMWAETPYVKTGDGTTLEDRWAVGLSCADTNADLVRRITAALRQPGSFVKKMGKAAVVVVPDSKVAAFVYFD